MPATNPERNHRWRATLSYTENGSPKTVVRYVEEIRDLQEIVEEGLSWLCLEHILIVYNRRYL